MKRVFLVRSFRLRASPRLSVLCLVGFGAFASAGRAATYTWQGGGANNNWGTAANWQGGAPTSDLANTDVVFGSSAVNASSLEMAYSVRSLTFNAGANAYTFDSGTLTLGSNGLTQNSASAQTFNNAVSLGTTTQTWNLNGGGALNFNGGLSGANYTLTANTSVNSTLSGKFNGVLLAKTGAGTLTLVSTGTGSQLTNLSVSGGNLTINSSTVSTNFGSVVNAGGTLNISGTGVLSSGGDVTLNGTSASPANLNVSGGGQLTLSTGISINLGGSGYGVFTQSGGTTMGQNFVLGGAAGGNGSYALSGGAITTRYAYIGRNSVGSVNQTSGTFTVSDSGGIYIGSTTDGTTGGNGSYTLSGDGVLTTQGVHIGGTGVFIQNGGTYNANSNTGVAGVTIGNGSYGLNGGALATNFVVGNSTASGQSSTFNLNGGALQVRVTLAGSQSLFQGMTHAYVQAGGAKIDVSGGSIAVASALEHDPALVGVADGGLTKTGVSTLTLNVASTYTGGTTVGGGSLAVAANGALGTGNVNVLSSAVSLTLNTGVTDAIADSARLTLAGGGTVGVADAGYLQLNGSVERVGSLQLGGTLYTAGTFTSAAYPEYFAGAGSVIVVPEPNVDGMLAASVAGWMIVQTVRRRREAQAAS